MVQIDAKGGGIAEAAALYILMRMTDGVASPKGLDLQAFGYA